MTGRILEAPGATAIAPGAHCVATSMPTAGHTPVVLRTQFPIIWEHWLREAEPEPIAALAFGTVLS